MQYLECPAWQHVYHNPLLYSVDHLADGCQHIPPPNNIGPRVLQYAVSSQSLDGLYQGVVNNFVRVPGLANPQ